MTSNKITTSAKNAEELAKEISSWIKQTGKIATLATDFCWWCKRFAFPDEGYTVLDSIFYEPEIRHHDILKALKAEECEVVILPDQSSFGWVYAKGQVPEEWRSFIK